MTTINNNNYFEIIDKIGVDKLPPTFQKSHDLYKRMFDQGGWEAIDSRESLSRVKAKYFTMLGEWYDKQENPKPAPKKKSPNAKQEPKPATPKPAAKKRTPKPAPKEKAPKLVNTFDMEHRIIRRYVNLHGKPKTKRHIRLFINYLQRAILEKKIRKTSPYAKEVKHIQGELIKAHDKIKTTEELPILLDEKVLADYREILGMEKLRPSIALLRSYLLLHGQQVPKKKAESLIKRIESAITKERVREDDPYYKDLKKVLRSLQKFIKQGCGILEIHSQQLHGITGILEGCDKGLGGLDKAPTIPPGSEWPTDQLPDFSHLQLGFSGRWQDLFNQPTRGFSAMVYGKPKTGKSTLMLDFAGYLVRNFGTVLWVEMEEDLFTVFKEKIDRLGVGHPDLVVRQDIPEDLSNYDFIFINSVSEGKISPQQIRELKQSGRGTSFVLIYHTRKDGDFRGAQEHAHLVDIVVEVKDGKAFANGRFGKGETVIRFE